MMRVAEVAPPWAPVPPRLYGGIEAMLDVLCRALKELGHEVVLLTTGDSTCPVERRHLLPSAEGQRIGMAVPEIRHVLWARREVERGAFDVVHDHTVAGPVLEALNPLTPPLVHTIHGPLNDELRDIYRQIGERVVLVGISRAQVRGAPEVRVQAVIHHGIDLEAFPFSEEAGSHLLFLGRMAPEKGAHTAVECARQVGMPIVLAGKKREAWEERYFKEMVEPALSSDVVYEGEVDHDRKLELLRSAAALLFPITWDEPFGLVMLEAMACGTPVVAYASGAAPEVIEEGVSGFLASDFQDLVEKTKMALDLPRRACRQHVERNFSADRMAREYADLFRGLVK
jgi:glycosyltransferase involved in cell wall biosynthesis